MKRLVLPVVTFLLCLAVPVKAQRGAGGAPSTSARDSAPIDLTGYWVSIVTEDWRVRMTTPPKGDYSNVPLNAEGRRVAAMWDPSAPVTGDDACKPYGAPAIMRLPVRLRIQWERESTLRVDIDAGQQTRLFHFGNPPPADTPAWQGTSKASWEFAGPRGARPAAGGSLKVVTTSLRPGYVRRNGVPYSKDAILTEYFDRHDDFGGQWITLTRILDDPQYLTQPHVLTSHFRKEPDVSKWRATPCEVIPPK